MACERSRSRSRSQRRESASVRAVREAIEAAANNGEEFGECPCCFENMIGDAARHPPSVMLGMDGRRARQGSGGRCEHIICHSCLRNLQTKTCPICRAKFDVARKLPSMWTKPQEWFRLVDVDNSGTLTKGEVAKALMVMIPVNQVLLERHIAANWHKWDTDASGAVDRQEFTQLAQDVKRVLYKKTRSGRIANRLTAEHALPHSAAERPMPDIVSQPRGWFEYWDVDSSGSLDREECVRAIMLTFDLAGKLHDRRQCVETVRSVFELFDSDGSDCIDYEEFESCGLWESVCGILQED